MAHLVESMFSVRQTPWHGLGRIVQDAPNTEEAIKLAGLDWNVQERPVFYQADDGSFKQVSGFKNLVRSDNGKVLSVMKNSYGVVQNSKAFSFFDPFIESGLASFETAGSLRDGKTVWVLACLNKAPLIVKGDDIVKAYLLLAHAHDGTMSVRAGFTPTRVVCNNTLQGAIGDKDSRLIRINHSLRVNDRLDQIQKIVDGLNATFQATEEQYRALAGADINQQDLLNYVNVVFELRPNGDDREKLRAKKMQETIVNLFENGAGAYMKSAKGTYWGAYNAVTEYLTHESSRSLDSNKNAESRLYGNWFGNQKNVNAFAFAEALKAV